MAWLMARSILFVLPSFGIGGTTVSTRNLISVLDKDKYDITVWALGNRGLLSWMYEDVPQLETCFIAETMVSGSWRKERNWLRRIAAAIVRFTANHIPKAKSLFIKRAIKKSIGSHQFDTVVACEEGFTTLFVSHIPSANRVAWVRCDYKRYFETRHRRQELFYEKYNHIVCVAEQAYRNFIEIYPNLKNRTACIYNPQDSNLILSQADIDDHDTRFRKDDLVIVSLGRLSKVKRFVEIPMVARKLKDDGLKFTWYIIGDGEEKTAIATAIEQQGVGDWVIMLGAKSNPHFYIKRADLYVCLSSSEACPRVINEAKILGTPVVSTDFPTVYEYLEDGINGRIVPLEDVADAIKGLLSNKEQYDSIKKVIQGFRFDNKELIEKLERIL